MKVLSLLALSLILAPLAVRAQSGRRSEKKPPAAPPVVAEPADKPAKPQPDRDKPQVAAISGEEYKCTNDGSLAVVVKSNEAEKIFAPNELTTKAIIRFRPKAENTREARQRSVQGNITLRVVQAASGKVSSVKIVSRGLPFGLNESAIHAACKIEFTPASKDGQFVTQWLKVEYTFRLESSIMRP